MVIDAENNSVKWLLQRLALSRAWAASYQHYSYQCSDEMSKNSPQNKEYLSWKVIVASGTNPQAGQEPRRLSRYLQTHCIKPYVKNKEIETL